MRSLDHANARSHTRKLSSFSRVSISSISEYARAAPKGSMDRISTDTNGCNVCMTPKVVSDVPE